MMALHSGPRHAWKERGVPAGERAPVDWKFWGRIFDGAAGKGRRVDRELGTRFMRDPRGFRTLCIYANVGGSLAVRNAPLDARPQVTGSVPRYSSTVLDGATERSQARVRDAESGRHRRDRGGDEGHSRGLSEPMDVRVRWLHGSELLDTRKSRRAPKVSSARSGAELLSGNATGDGANRRVPRAETAQRSKAARQASSPTGTEPATRALLRGVGTDGADRRAKGEGQRRDASDQLLLRCFKVLRLAGW